MQRSKLTIVAAAVVLICSNVVLGFDPLGPPRALLGQGKPSVGVDYMYSKMEIKMEGFFGFPDMDVSDLEVNKLYANVGYGLTDRWDIFARLGGAVIDIDRGENITNPSSMIGTSDPSLAIGAGTRVTLFEWEQVCLGMLAQVSFTPYENFKGNPHSTLFASPATMQSEMHLTEVQIAFGPTWNCTEYLSVYGGPFLHLIDGNADLLVITTSSGSALARPSIEQSTILGGYIGATLRFSEHPNISCNFEFQITESGHALAIQIAISP